jgi:hypothetical protein
MESNFSDGSQHPNTPNNGFVFPDPVPAQKLSIEVRKKIPYIFVKGSK